MGRTGGSTFTRRAQSESHPSPWRRPSGWRCHPGAFAADDQKLPAPPRIGVMATLIDHPPPRMTLSLMITVPGRKAPSPRTNNSCYSLVGIDEDQVERLAFLAPRAAEIAPAGPTRNSTRPTSPARTKFGVGDLRVMRIDSSVQVCRPSASARAIQIVEYPPSVPISRIFFAP